ncbi:unnamed protein product [Cuscuta epithymum]|uniref:Uncharacterized protein n=1 Tax=Cuscuta epithymum TaxID=186058 RepID=A0AAV0D8J5_9ASTE|nr:unnamed protein product [Cuscuta epithymum]
MILTNPLMTLHQIKASLEFNPSLLNKGHATHGDSPPNISYMVVWLEELEYVPANKSSYYS